MRLKSRMTLAALFLPFVVGSFAPLHGVQEPAGPAKPSEAASKPEPALQFQFGVKGLTPANLVQAKENLIALSTQIFACGSCKLEQPTAGVCDACGQELQAQKRPILQEAVPSADSESIRVVVVPGRTLRLSEIEGALKKSAIQLDAERFPVSGRAVLVLRGGMPDSAAVIEKRLAEAKLFEEVHAIQGSPSGEIRLAVRAGPTPPMQAKVASVIEGAGTKAKLADLVWGRSPPKG